MVEIRMDETMQECVAKKRERQLGREGDEDEKQMNPRENGI